MTRQQPDYWIRETFTAAEVQIIRSAFAAVWTDIDAGLSERLMTEITRQQWPDVRPGDDVDLSLALRVNLLDLPDLLTVLAGEPDDGIVAGTA